MRRSAIRPVFQVLRPGALLFGAAAAFALGSCMPGHMPAFLHPSAPESMRELGSGEPGEIWLALPMNAWLGPEAGAGEPETIVACIGPQCPARLAAGVFRLTGEAARRAERDLRDPRALIARIDGAEAVTATGEAFSQDGLAGFSLTIAARGDGGRAVHGAALGGRDGDALRFALAIGDDAAIVRAAVVQIARSEALSSRP